MAASKAQINWSAVSFASSPITRVSNMMFGQGGKLLAFKGDADVYPSIVAAVDSEPHAHLTSADVAALLAFATGQTGTLTGTLNDAKLASGGAVIFTMTGSVFENADATGAHAAFASGTATWKGSASDGATNPLAITRA